MINVYELMIRVVLAGLISFGCQLLAGQPADLTALKKEVSYLADIANNAMQSEHRMRAHDEMVIMLDSFLISDGSYLQPLDSIDGLSVVKGEDFRIITWQLRVSEDEYTYGGRFQTNDNVIKLNDSRPFVNGANRTTFSPATWYGCIYYQIHPFEIDKVTYYLLFGFNGENNLINTKVVDVLDLSSGTPVLGAPVFISPEGPQSRIILHYADVSAVYLALDAELKGIVHSHLATMPGVGPQGEALPVSDGSLEAWIFRKGNWLYEEEVYDVKVKDPPMTDERKGRKEDRDIMGRPIKG
jgi:hypothetical protein